MAMDASAFGPDGPSKTRAALGLTGSAGRGLGSLFGSPTFTNVGRAAGGLADLLRIPGIVNSNASDPSKAIGSAGAVTSAASQFSRAPAVASAFPAATSALNSGINIGTNAAGSAANVPYLSMIGAGFNIANTAMDPNISDGQKAYRALHQVGRTVADAYLPVVGGLAADLVSAPLEIALFGGGDYVPQRMNEAHALPGHMRGLSGLLSMAPDQATLDDMLTAWGNNGEAFRADKENGQLVLRGTHLDLGRAEGDINNLYRQRQALFAAAQAGDPAAQAQLARDAQRFGVLKGSANTLAGASTLDPNLAVPKATLASVFGGVPQQTEDAASKVIDNWIDAADQYRRENELSGTFDANRGQYDKQLGTIQQYLDASNTLGLDLDAARERRQKRNAEDAINQASMNSIGGM